MFMYNLIDRNRAVDALKNTNIRVTGIRIGKTILAQYAEGCRNKLIEVIEAIPTVNDVEKVRHGYWIDGGKTEKGSRIIQCSYCGKERKGTSKSAYCRDCGAKMDQEECGFLI
jgi:hypothetical protein